MNSNTVFDNAYALTFRSSKQWKWLAKSQRDQLAIVRKHLHKDEVALLENLIHACVQLAASPEDIDLNIQYWNLVDRLTAKLQDKKNCSKAFQGSGLPKFYSALVNVSTMKVNKKKG